MPTRRPERCAIQLIVFGSFMLVSGAVTTGMSYAGLFFFAFRIVGPCSLGVGGLLFLIGLIMIFLTGQCECCEGSNGHPNHSTSRHSITRVEPAIALPKMIAPPPYSREPPAHPPSVMFTPPNQTYSQGDFAYPPHGATPSGPPPDYTTAVGMQQV